MSDSGTADRLFAEANSKLSGASKGGFFSFGSKSEKYEEAADKFKDAANAYRTVRNLKKSGQSFERAADIHRRYLSDPQEAAKMLQDAYKSYKDDSPSDAIRCLDQSIQLYTAKGNFRRAADMMCDLSDMYEVKLEDIGKALQCLETAITWYTDENIPATANKWRQKAGQLAAVMGDYYKAAGLFVACAEAASAIGQTARFSIKTYLFKAGVCQLATGDIIGVKKAIDSWVQLDRTFLSEREGRFISDLTESMEAQDADKFAQIAANWDKMTPMEDWMVTVLLSAKKHAEVDEAEDELA